MKVADPHRGFQKFREDILKRRESFKKPQNPPQSQNNDTNINYNKVKENDFITNKNHLQDEINDLKVQINCLQRNNQPTKSPPPAYQPRPVNKNTPANELSLTGLGLITLFLAGVGLYLYKTEAYVQNMLNKAVSNSALTHNILFVAIISIGIILLIAGLTRRK